MRLFMRCVILSIAPALLSSCSPELTRRPAGVAALTVSQWVPTIAGSGSQNHQPASIQEREELYVTGPLNGLSATFLPTRELSVSFQVPSDMGDNGSISLVAQVEDIPASLTGSAYAILVSLTSPTGHDWVNARTDGTQGDCLQSGLFKCPSFSCTGAQCKCTENLSCTVNSPSAFLNREQWSQRQLPAMGFSSVNTFPTCNWNVGSPACTFNSTYFVNQRLPSGSYEARYILLSSDYAELTSFSARLHVSLIKKKSPAPQTAQNGAVDLNIILVGSKNVSDSRTAKGRQNLNQLFSTVQGMYDQQGLGLKLGQLRAFDWNDSTGESFANTPVENLAELFEVGSRGTPPETDAKSINIFLVSTLPYSSANVTVLGVAGSIPGPMLRGTGSSGLAFSSFEQLATFNPLYPKIESTFNDLATTVAHELGHYLGLNHPNESDGTTYDPTGDTPRCTPNGQGMVTHSSCENAASCAPFCSNYNGIDQFCPSISGCQFNHTMWYTTKPYSSSLGIGDGNFFSTQSSRIMLYNPLIW